MLKASKSKHIEDQGNCCSDYATEDRRKRFPRSFVGLKSEPSPANNSDNHDFHTTFYHSDTVRGRVAAFISGKKAALVIALNFAALILYSAYQWYRISIEAIEADLSKQAYSLAANIRGSIETELNSRLHVTYGLAGLVRSNERVNETQFQQFAADLANDRSSIMSLQLAPQGIVQYVWPYDRHKKAIGHNLLEDSRRKAAAEDAINSRKIWLAGPLSLIQGGEAIIGRYPIFKSNSIGDEIFWGFATVLIDFDQFKAEVGINRELDNVDIAIRGVDGQGNQGDAFIGDVSLFNSGAAIVDVQLPAGSWKIAVKPHKSAISHFSMYLFILAVIALLTLPVAIYFLLRLPNKLEQVVKDTTAALKQSETRFSDAIEALPDGFVIFDEYDQLKAFNSKFEEIYPKCKEFVKPGITYEQLIRKGVLGQQYFGVNENNIEEFIESKLKQHRGTSINEEQLSDGRWIRQVERPVRGGGTVGLRVDITELKNKEQELALAKEKAESANKAKSSFLATVSHEVRTPLNVIIGLLSILNERAIYDKEEQKYLKTAYQSAHQLLHLLNEILDLSKVEAGKLVLDEAQFNLSNLVNNIYTMTENLARDKNISLKCEIDSDVARFLIGDEGRIHQVLLNLVNNAIKFTEQGGVYLNVSQQSTDNDKCNLIFTVKDTGIGFSDTDVDKLFLPFSQIDNSLTRRHEGTGLGLTICHELVSLMGGTITAKGCLDEGAEFTVVLPLTISNKSRKSLSKRKQNIDKNSGTQTPRILVVEDSASNQIVFNAFLTGQGYLVDMADNGRVALQQLENETYDVILMDIYMPEMNGIEATQKIRESERFKNIPIVALTANAMKGDKEKFINAGMNDYLPKPVEKEALLSTIDKWLNKALS